MKLETQGLIRTINLYIYFFIKKLLLIKLKPKPLLSVKFKPYVFFMCILIEMVNPLCVDEGAAPLDPTNLVALIQQKLCEIGAILSRNTCD